MRRQAHLVRVKVGPDISPVIAAARLPAVHPCIAARSCAAAAPAARDVWLQVELARQLDQRLWERQGFGVRVWGWILRPAPAVRAAYHAPHTCRSGNMIDPTLRNQGVFRLGF